MKGTLSSNRKDSTKGGTDSQARKTHCPKGHEYSLKNTYIYKNRRMCKVCSYENTKRYRAERG